MPLNPNSARDEVNSFLTKPEADKASMYPLFFNMVRLETVQTY